MSPTAAVSVSPTLFREAGFRFFFFSREEARLHVHVAHADGEAKFWLEPSIQLAQNFGLDDRQLRTAQALIARHEHEIRYAWRDHFGR
jgi:Domain of unknown function (DUF4160)